MYNTIDKTTIIPVFETERLILRPFRAEDAADVFEYSGDPENTRFMLWETNRTIEDVRAFLAAEIAKYADGGNYDYAFVLKSENKLIGTGGAAVYDGYFARTAELGYILNKRYWGRGLAAEAMRPLCEFLFNERDIRRIQAKHFVENPASGKVMRKLGMEHEGTLRDYLWARGAFRTVEMYAMLQP
jgi:ribosomal-protein-alanine N-acetyltransferase